MSPRSRSEHFVELIMRYRSQLFGFIYALVPSINDAEDIFQQTSVVLWEKFDQFQPGTSFPHWAFQIARNKIYDWHKSNQRRGTLFTLELSDRLAELAADDAENDARSQDQLDALLQCIDKLREKDRELVRHCYGESVGVGAAAQQLGRSPSSVCNSLRRIRTALIDCVRVTLSREAHQG